MIRVAVCGAHHIPEVGGKTRRPFETAVRGPGVRAALRQVLPAHQDIVHDGAPSDKVIDVLARVGLVAHQEAPFSKTEILNQDGVQAQLLPAPVLDIDAPEPEVAVRMQPEADLMAEAVLFSLPDEPVVRAADPARRLGADQGERHGLGPPCAEIEAARTAGDRRPQDLVDHDPLLTPRVLDREDRAVWQKADRETGPIGDARETEILLARGSESSSR